MGATLATLASRHAQRLAGRGQLRSAYELLVNLRDANTADPSLHGARLELESRLLGELRNRFSNLTAIPRQAVAPDDLRRHKLQAFDAYVWNFFDGSTSLQDAVDVVSASELDVLYSVAKLADLALITMPRQHTAAA